MPKIVECLWLTSEFGPIGIVVTEDEVTKNREAYISGVRGLDEKTDQSYVAEYGARFPIEMIQRLEKALTKK
jgi:hypothetical protein